MQVTWEKQSSKNYEEENRREERLRFCGSDLIKSLLLQVLPNAQVFWPKLLFFILVSVAAWVTKCVFGA